MSDVSNFGGPTTTQQLERVLLGKRIPVPAVPGVRTATVISATTTTVTFTIDGFDAQASFTGRYEPRFNDAEPTRGQIAPPAGTKCAVVFSGNDLTDGWVLSFAGWPAA